MAKYMVCNTHTPVKSYSRKTSKKLHSRSKINHPVKAVIYYHLSIEDVLRGLGK